MGKCTNPQCFREAKLIARAWAPYCWEEEENPETCIPCYLAIYYGSQSMTNEATYEIIEGSEITEGEFEDMI